jgi:hypothetical protein
MTRNQLIVLAVGVLVLAVVVILIMRRVRYVKALKGRGWSFDSSPSLQAVLDHQAPPFGLGFDREPDELITGTTRSGVPFRVFEYACSGGGPRFDGRLASLQLPFALPDLFLSSSSSRTGVPLPPLAIEPGLDVRAADERYARAVLDGPVLASVRGFGQATSEVDLSIDGNHLVAAGAPKDPDELAAYLEALAPVALALGAPALQPYAVSTPVPRLGFYGRPDWQLVPVDDTLITKYGLTTVGFGHRTEKVIRAGNDGLPLEAFVHRWKTRRTETYTDSDGRRQTRTVTEDHSEVVCAVVLPFVWPLLSVDGGWGGEKVRFESEEFNDAFTVRTSDPRFASAVIHPRQMEFLLAARPPGFRIEGQQMRFFPAEHDTLLVGKCADVAHGFFARVPAFVWKDLQTTPPFFRS